MKDKRDVGGLIADAQSGAASLFAAGNVSGTVTSKTSVTASAMQDVSGTYGFGGNVSVFAGQSGTLIALGDVFGTVTAGADGSILSEGNVTNSAVHAGKDAFVSAYGNVLGTFTGARDASVITYGSFNGLVYAGRDVVAVGTGSSLTGTIVADRNIGQHAYYDDESDYDSSGTTFDVTGFGDTVFAYGTINAAFYALNTTSSVIGGRIGSVQAVDAISGVIQAANEIGPVASGSTGRDRNRTG